MIAPWIEKTFSSDQLSLVDIYKILDLMHATEEAVEMSGSVEFLYELAKVNSTAAFVLWQMQRQKRLSAWLNESVPGALLPETQIITGNLTALLREKNIIILKNGKGFKLSANHPGLKQIEKPMAYRSLSWFEPGEFPKESFVFNQNELEWHLAQEIIPTAILIAGAKFRSYQLAVDYATKRIQGGRKILDWSSVQSILSELFLSVKADEAMIKNMNSEIAFSIMKDADYFVSQNMQIFGGAGYMEDYTVERLYRECIFLKNWPRPFKEQLMNHYQNQVGHLS